MVSDVVLERFFTDNVSAVAPVGKRQKSSAPIAASIRDTFHTASFYWGQPREEDYARTATHSSGPIAWLLPAFVSVAT
jgi:hypothetical protein